MSRRLERVARFALERRWAVFAGWGLLVLAALPGLLRLRIDNAPALFFPEEAAPRRAWEDLTERFGPASALRVVIDGERLFAPGGLESVRRLADELSAIAGVVAVDRPRAFALVGGGQAGGTVAPQTFRERLAASRLDRELGFTSVDGSAISLAATLAPAGPAERRARLAAIERAAERLPTGLRGVVVGLPTLDRALDDASRDVFRRLLPLLVATSLLLLLVTFRDAVAVAAPILFVSAVGVVVFGAMGWWGVTFDLVLAVLPPVLFSIGLALAVHLLIRCRDLGSAGGSERDAIGATYAEKGRALFWTTVSTAVGFGALAATPIAPIRTLGVWGALAMLLAGAGAVTLYPGLMLHFPGRLRRGLRAAPNRRRSAPHRPSIGWSSPSPPPVDESPKAPPAIASPSSRCLPRRPSSPASAWRACGSRATRSTTFPATTRCAPPSHAPRVSAWASRRSSWSASRRPDARLARAKSCRASRASPSAAASCRERSRPSRSPTFSTRWRGARRSPGRSRAKSSARVSCRSSPPIGRASAALRRFLTDDRRTTRLTLFVETAGYDTDRSDRRRRPRRGARALRRGAAFHATGQLPLLLETQRRLLATLTVSLAGALPLLVLVFVIILREPAARPARARPQRLAGGRDPRRDGLARRAGRHRDRHGRLDRPRSRRRRHDPHPRAVPRPCAAEIGARAPSPNGWKRRRRPSSSPASFSPPASRSASCPSSSPPPASAPSRSPPSPSPSSPTCYSSPRSSARAQRELARAGAGRPLTQNSPFDRHGIPLTLRIARTVFALLCALGLAPLARPAAADITGFVRVAGSGNPGTPIAGAWVHVQGDLGATGAFSSAPDGAFTLTGEPGRRRSVVAASMPYLRTRADQLPDRRRRTPRTATPVSTSGSRSCRPTDDPNYVPGRLGAAAAAAISSATRSGRPRTTPTPRRIAGCSTSSPAPARRAAAPATSSATPTTPGETGFCATCHAADRRPRRSRSGGDPARRGDASRLRARRGDLRHLPPDGFGRRGEHQRAPPPRQGDLPLSGRRQGRPRRGSTSGAR